MERLCAGLLESARNGPGYHAAVIDVLPTALTVVALLGAAWAVLLMIKKTPLMPPTRLTWGLAGLLALLEIGSLVQAIIGIVQLAGTDREVNGVTFVGYLVAPVIILPVAFVWGAADRSRWSGGVVLVACLSVPVMILRMQQLWAGHG
jgi:hypothetical protein